MKILAQSFHTTYLIFFYLPTEILTDGFLEIDLISIQVTVPRGAMVPYEGVTNNQKYLASLSCR